MADPTPRLILESDLVIPDWSTMDAGDVWLAAQQKVPEAIAELAKREAAFAAGTAVPKPSGPRPSELRAALRRRSRR